MFDILTPRPQQQPRSLLSRTQRLWLGTAIFLAAVLLANTLYLLSNRVSWLLPGGPSESTAEGVLAISKLFQVMVLSHTGLGFVVVLMFLLFAVWHLPHVWRRHRRQTVISGLLFVTIGLALAVTGPFIVYASASRNLSWVWWLHVVAGALVPVAYLVHRFLSHVPPRPGRGARFAAALCVAFLVMMGGHALSHREAEFTAEAKLAQERGSFSGPGSKDRAPADYAPGRHVSASFVPPASPFFPSAATTTTGDHLPHRIITRGETPAPEAMADDLDQFGFAVNEKIGAESCARCHADIVEQWSRSAHRFASFNNPFYEATINDMRENATSLTEGVADFLKYHPQWQDRVAQIKSQWCSGCHDPALMLAGQMTPDIDRRSVQAQAGLTCLACHAIDKLHNTTGNAPYNIADHQEDPYIFADADGGTLAAYLHDAAVKAKPDVHKAQMLKPFFRSAEFCSACHKVSLQEPVNNYRWLRGQNEYDNWHDSGVAHNASRTFYLPPEPRVCQDCHMPSEPAVLGDVAAKNGMVRSHRFLAVNTALPFVRGDQETIERIEAFLRDEKLRIDVFALKRDGEDVPIDALHHRKPSLVAGETMTVDVVVRNLGVGHTFPGGTNDSNESWIEFTLLDEQGELVAQSGFVRPDRFVDPSAHYFRALIVDRHARPIRRRNAQDIYAPVYVNVIGPGTAHTVHYRVQVPPDAGVAVTLRARLMWRKFDRGYTEFAYNANPEGFKRFDRVPNLPVTEISSAEVTLPVAESRGLAEVQEIDHGILAADWVRFNDYGIGLLLEGDTKAAEKAFATVAELVPDRVDGFRNMARAALQEGRLEDAYQHLLACEERLPNDPQTAWFWGVLLQADGRYVEAASAYRRVLQRFPDDRAVWRNLGRTYYLDGKFEQAIEAMEQVLQIDPEDRVAHYHIMLAGRALGASDRAARAEEAYVRYKIDESADEVTQAYRLKHPHDNVEAQPIHVHELTPGALVGRTEAEVAMSPSRQRGESTEKSPLPGCGGTTPR